MLVLPGSSALSEARFELLATAIGRLNLGYQLRDALHAYVVDVHPDQALDQDRLAALLQLSLIHI